MSDDDTIRNPRTGQSMRFEHVGDVLRIETVNPPGADAEPLHVHPFQESRARVRSGTLRFEVDGVERRVDAGQEIVVPAGVPHRFANDGQDDAVAVQEFRPALDTETFFRTYFALVEQGKVDDNGRPSLLTMALVAPRFGREIRVVSPPWPVQRALFAVLAPVARVLGHRSPER